MKVAHISQCKVSECAYNQTGTCHALAITVGGPGDHDCDTFCNNTQKGGIASAVGSVGACKVTDCMHNNGLECVMHNIQIGMQQGHVACLSYET